MDEECTCKVAGTIFKKVYERKDEILKECSRTKEESKKFAIQFIGGLKGGIKLMIFKWKMVRKRE